MKTNHTPGPWQIDNSHNAGNPATLGQMNIKDGNGNLISRCDVGMFWSSNGTANARLIAAAPDLLSALQSIVARVDSPGGTIVSITYKEIVQARAAIARAT